MNKSQLVPILLAIVVVIVSIGWFVQNFELREVDEYTGFRGEAKTNPLFASRLLLKRMGIPAETPDTLSTLPDTNTVLVINTPRYTLSAQKVEEILAWVKRGGHLITRARTSNAITQYMDDDEEEESDSAIERDPLQTALGIRIGEHVMPEDEDLPLAAELSGMEEALELDPGFFYSLHSENTDANTLSYKEHTWLLEQPWGNGLVTVVANLDFIENGSIHQYEHATFFWHMLHSLHTEPANIWLIHTDDMPPLWQLIWEHAWALVLSLAMLIPLTILAHSPRFGPLIPKPQPERRRILEHIHASGLFMWKRYSKHTDARYQDFAQTVEQLYPSTRKPHDNKQPDA
ncbi:MAG: DUF4350 domain-containing protein [Candidatus Thiothrix moscowensis]|nr:DUF4350 domain-containing protein [Candidatus Thiothrix moscowensis]